MANQPAWRARHRQCSMLGAALLSVVLTILMLGPAPDARAAAASISLGVSSGPAGSSVTVTGTGFPRKQAGTLGVAGAVIPIRVSASGYFKADVRIPASAQGTVLVEAIAGTGYAAEAFTVTTPAAESPVVSPSSLRFGVGTPGGPLAAAELDAVSVLAGEAPSVVLSYKDFRQAPPLSELDAVRARGAITLLTWEPWVWGQGTNQPAYSLDRITEGDFDPYLRQWGAALAQWGHPIMLRFGHEMNGNWYPWVEGINGNGSGDYVAAWRHVHDVLAATGASNVDWVWSPNVPYAGSTPLTQLYPGADYVDSVSLDGYNWGTSVSWSAWIEPAALFGSGLQQVRDLAPGKQILISETASAEAGGSKAAWNRALVEYLSDQPDVSALVWFHFTKETDWRIDSSASSSDALAAALALRTR